MIFDERSRPCWRRWALRSILLQQSLGHEPGGKETRTVVRHYVHTDMLERKAHALSAWDERLKSIVSGEEREKVVQLPRAG